MPPSEANLSQSPVCRVCRAVLPTPTFQLEGMPGSAQGFPTAETVVNDSPHHIEICECSGCGLVQLPGPPVPYFREVIRAAAFSPSMRSFRLTQFRNWIDRYDLSGKKLIELGCGRGEYLGLLAQLGVSAHGFEYAPDAVTHCRQTGLAVQQGFVEGEAQRIPDAPYDAFVTLNFLEHWPDPVGSLRGIAASLGRNGVGLVEVPNFDMILKKGLYFEFIGDHLSYFTQRTLSFTLEAAGFDVLDCQVIWHDYIISATVRRRQALNFDKLTTRSSEVKVSLLRFIEHHGSGKVAVWGAGHQALAAIALSGIHDRLAYVIDSAPFKQGKFTPATHLPIYAPDILDHSPVTAIIVMAASYSDEVVAQIRVRWGARFALAVLRDFGVDECR